MDKTFYASWILAAKIFERLRDITHGKLIFPDDVVKYANKNT